ncbi:MAG: DUF4339 domain-containing protein [Planctomycetaceae bacterium]|nr:DUF4339 domain-containing protein [Planctomycetaceae bacterium]
MASRWIVKRKDKEQGPFTSEQLKKLAASGQLRTTDLIRKHNSDQYVKADKVKGLFDDSSSKSSRPKRSSGKQPEMLVAEVVEVIDEPPQELEVLEEIDEPIALNKKGSSRDFDIDESNVFEEEYDDYEADDEFEDDFGEEYEDYEDYAEPASRRPRRAHHSSPDQRSRSKSRKKKNADSDEIEEGPWYLLFSGFGCIGCGLMLFFAIGPEGVEITGVGLKVWLMMALNKIGGRWAIMIFFMICGIWSFAQSYKKFARR